MVSAEDLYQTILARDKELERRRIRIEELTAEVKHLRDALLEGCQEKTKQS